MLTFYDHDLRGTRRSFLRVGTTAALGACGLSLANLSELARKACRGC